MEPKNILKDFNEDLDVLLSGSGIPRQISAIQGMYRRLPEEKYVEYRTLITSLNLISSDTWEQAEIELSQN